MNGLVSSNVAGNTKKTTVNAMVAVFTSLGGFSGPYAFKGLEAKEGYPTAMIAILSMLCLWLGLNAALW